ncbi:hypothetical protein TNCV_4269091 [Trichonephila clavipes]|nr:hypothetical protein TNCV_4269091 [Trichonephila clavipes]
MTLGVDPLLSGRFQRVPNSPTGSPMTPKRSPKSPTWPPKMMPAWLYRQNFAKFSLNRHYNEYLIIAIFSKHRERKSAAIDGTMQQNIWNDLDYRLDLYRVTKG